MDVQANSHYRLRVHVVGNTSCMNIRIVFRISRFVTIFVKSEKLFVFTLCRKPWLKDTIFVVTNCAVIVTATNECGSESPPYEEISVEIAVQ